MTKGGFGARDKMTYDVATSAHLPRQAGIRSGDDMKLQVRKIKRRKTLDELECRLHDPPEALFGLGIGVFREHYDFHLSLLI
jgi:hypothetical protein